jgi:hypothetical protein
MVVLAALFDLTGDDAQKQLPNNYIIYDTIYDLKRSPDHCPAEDL